MDDGARVNRDARAAGRTRLHHHANQQVGLRRDVLADERRGMGARETRAPRSHRHFEPKAIARHDGQSEFRVVDPSQIRPRGRAIAPLREQDGCDLRERLDHQDARHQGRAGKVPLKKLLADRDILVRDDAASGLVLRHRVNEGGRIAIAEAIEDFRDVYRRH